VDREGLLPPPLLRDEWMKVGAENAYTRNRGAIPDRCYRFEGLVSVGLLRFDEQAFADLGIPGPRHRIVLRADIAGNGRGPTRGRPIPGFGGAEFQGNRCAYFALGLATSDWPEGQRVLPEVNAQRVGEPLPQQPQSHVAYPILNSTFEKFDVDVTDIIRAWISRRRPNFGFAILPYEARDGQTIRWVRESNTCWTGAHNWRLVLLPLNP
jgi:hypothetical protein